MISISAGVPVTVQCVLKDANGNETPAVEPIVWSSTGPVTLADPWFDSKKRRVDPTGAGSGTITVTSGALTKTEAFTVAPGAPTSIEIVVV